MVISQTPLSMVDDDRNRPYLYNMVKIKVHGNIKIRVSECRSFFVYVFMSLLLLLLSIYLLSIFLSSSSSALLPPD
jgi:hypothetical protein